MAPPTNRGRGPSKAPAAAPPAPRPPRLPSIDPPEVWEGRRLASQPSTTSDASEAPSLLAMGAPRAAGAQAASATAAAAADQSAGGGSFAVPAPPRPPRPVRGQQLLQSAPSMVDAVVNMQPLPTSSPGSPAPPSSPACTAVAAAAGPEAARQAAGPAAAAQEGEAPPDERPLLMPASSTSSSATGSTRSAAEEEEAPEAVQAAVSERRQQAEQERQQAQRERAGHEEALAQAQAAEEGEEAGEDDDGASFQSATSGRYLTPGSSVGPDLPGSSSSSDGSRAASPQRRPPGVPSTWLPLQPTVEPPPRPAGSVGASVGSGAPIGSPDAAPGSAGCTRPAAPAAYQQEQDAPVGRAAQPPAFARLDSEGVHAPPPSPAGSGAPSAASSAAPSVAVSPAVTPKAGSPTSRKGLAVAPPVAPSAPASPATPAALAAAPPRPPWQPQATTAPVAAAQPPEAQHGGAPAAGSWPGAPPPWRQAPSPRPLQGAFVPQRRSRLAQEGGGGAAAPVPAASREAEGHPAPNAASAVTAPSSAAAAPEQAAVASAESRAAAARGGAQQLGQEGGRRQGQQQQQGQGQEPQAGPAGSAATSSSGEPQLTEIRGEWPPLPAEPEAPGPWPATQASSAQLQQAGSPLWGGMRSAFQAAALGQQPSTASSPAWRHLDDGSWHEPGGEVDWEAPSSPSVAFGTSSAAAGAAGTAGTMRMAGTEAEALIHDSLVEAASHSPPLSPTTTRLLALHRPSAELRRGPQRAASLGPGLSLPERQPSMLSPERQHFRLASQPSSPLVAAGTAQLSLPQAGGSHRSSWPGSPAAQRSAPQPSFRDWGQQTEPPGSPAAASQVRRSLDSISRQAGLSSLRSSSLAASGGMPASRLRPPGYPPHQPELLPVLNASPDVAGAGSQASPASSFRAPSAGGPAGSPASRFGGLGGLPLPPALGLEAAAVDKRDSRGLRFADLSPREAYAEEGATALSALRRPLLPRNSRAFPGGIEFGDLEAGGSLAGGGQGSSWWSSAALLASSALGVGLVALPRALSLLGLVAGGVGLALTVLLALLAYHCTSRAGADLAGIAGRGPAVVADVARAALGPFWAALSDVALVANCFGLMAASLVVAGDILVGSGPGDGLLGDWGSDRATVLAVLCAVVMLPLLCFRDVSYLSGSGSLSVSTSAMWAAALLALTVAALSQGAACHLPAFPSWRHLHGGGRRGGGWFARTVELLAAAPVLLVAPSCLLSALTPVARQLRPQSTARLRSATSAALLYCAGLAALLAACACLLFGRSVQADVLSSITSEALASLAGDPAGPAAFLLIRLAFLVALVAGFPLLMGPFRDALWRVLFWQPLLQGAGLLLVTLLALAGALAASLQVSSLWQLLSVLGGTSGALLVLVIPGLVAASGTGTGGDSAFLHRASGCVLALVGFVMLAATLLRLALFPGPA